MTKLKVGQWYNWTSAKAYCKVTGFTDSHVLLFWHKGVYSSTQPIKYTSKRVSAVSKLELLLMGIE